MTMPAQPGKAMAAQILDALPQTQCTRCGYADCADYSQAIASGEADINQCPPGGAEGVVRLARITGRPEKPLDPAFGQESVRQTMFIDEDWCIGCTLCIEACPTDAIIGSSKRMHTVIERYCTGCELCIPVCPVDCIKMEPASGSATGWAAWSQPQADLARVRYVARNERRQRADAERTKRHAAQVQLKLSNLAEHSRIEDPVVLDHKRAIIEAAMARARSLRAADPGKD